jgi:hypothetical protein
MESKVLEDLELDGRNINLVLKSMVVKTLGSADRMNSALTTFRFRYLSQCQMNH